MLHFIYIYSAFFSLCFYVGLVTVSYLQCLFAFASAPLSCVVVTCIRITAWNRNQKMHKQLVATRQQIGNCVCCSRAQSNKTTHISFKCIQCNIHTHTRCRVLWWCAYQIVVGTSAILKQMQTQSEWCDNFSYNLISPLPKRASHNIWMNN